MLLGMSSLYIGELIEARTHLENALSLCNPQENKIFPSHIEQDPIISCLSALVQALGLLGYPDQALQHAYAALQRSQEVPHPYSAVYALVHATWIHHLRREAHMTQEQAEATLKVCEEQDFAMWRAFGHVYRGWALVDQEQGEEGLALMHHGIVTSPDRLMRPREYAFLAEAYARQGQIDKGLAILTEQIDLVERSDGRFYTAELYCLKGELLLQPPAADTWQAERALRHALDLSKRSQAKWWELRAAMSLSRLWQRQGKRHAAHQLLAEVYDWFTEGFDTADLQEANALLEDLQT